MVVAVVVVGLTEPPCPNPKSSKNDILRRESFEGISNGEAFAGLDWRREVKIGFGTLKRDELCGDSW